MKKFRRLLRKNARRRIAFSLAWQNEINKLPSLSLYHTTKRAQLDASASLERFARLVEIPRAAIEQVISESEDQLKRMYPSTYLGTVHKHYRSAILERRFRSAYSSLSTVQTALGKLRTNQKKAEDALHSAEIEYEKLHSNQKTKKNKLNSANRKQQQKRDQLVKIKADIARLEETRDKEQDKYHREATKIFEDCREIEQERLDQLQQSLVKFLQVIHTSEYSAGCSAIFDELLSKIQHEQNSLADVNFWANAYHVNILPTTTDENNENNITTDSRITPKESNENDQTEHIRSQ